MIQSMTGYSRTARQIASGTVTVELRSTNHRYLEIEQRLPEELVGMKAQVAQLIKGKAHRGRIELSVTVQTSRAATRRLVVDEALARSSYEALVKLRTRLGLKDAVTLSQLLAFPLVHVTDHQADHELLWPPIRQAIGGALRQLIAVRRREGKRLLKDLQAQQRLIRARLAAIRAHLPTGLLQQQRRLIERLKTLLGHAPVSLSQVGEALALVKEGDVHEELVRLESHLTHMQQLLGRPRAVGKPLDFIAQELMREANTLGAKANDGTIARHVIEIKGAIERIREQAQNLE